MHTHESSIATMPQRTHDTTITKFQPVRIHFTLNPSVLRKIVEKKSINNFVGITSNELKCFWRIKKRQSESKQNTIIETAVCSSLEIFHSRSAQRFQKIVKFPAKKRVKILTAKIKRFCLYGQHFQVYFVAFSVGLKFILLLLSIFALSFTITICKMPSKTIAEKKK